MKLLKWGFGLVALLVLAVFGVASIRPGEFSIKRSVVVDAEATDVYPLISDLKQFEQWSPWMKLDPNQKTTYSATTSGVGAWMAWAGNDQVGEGKQTIVGGTPNQSLDMKLEFIKPFASLADVHFGISPATKGVSVEWSMSGHNNMMSKVMGLFMDMDEMVGADFVKGLNSLKSIAESNAKARLVAAAAAAQAPVDVAPSELPPGAEIKQNVPSAPAPAPAVAPKK